MLVVVELLRLVSIEILRGSWIVKSRMDLLSGLDEDAETEKEWSRLLQMRDCFWSR